MDEEGGVKAPVTRLRRRLSTEQTDDLKSPTPSTPTKKRGGRLAKPQLELINENTPENSTKRTTRRSIVKEASELEEKPLTPSRRSTRIKSNTSIISDTPQGLDSPRAKRATRRNSHVGSDTEAPITPARTRRAWKDSASTVEKPVEAEPVTKSNKINDIIVEEPEITQRLSSVSVDPTEKSPKSSGSPSPRKSPRLKAKEINSPKTNQVTKDPAENNENNDVKTTPRENNKEILSESLTNLIQNVDTSNKKSYLNKTASILDETNSLKSKRQRTKSWSTLNSSGDGSFLSDNENNKKKLKNKNDIKILSRKKGSGDNEPILNDKINNTEKEYENKNDQLNISSKKRKRNSLSGIPSSIDKAAVEKSEKALVPKDFISNVEKQDKVCETLKFFEKSPELLIQSLVMIEDSDSNTPTGENEKFNEDQCVPVVENMTSTALNDLTDTFKKNSSFQTTNNNVLENDPSEPMDVDETMPEVSAISEGSPVKNGQTEKASPNISKAKSLNSSKIKQTMSETNRSSRKSDVRNETKSTLVLSQTKDISSSENDQGQMSTSNIENLPESGDAKDNVKNENLKNISLNICSTSTPVQDKKVKKNKTNSINISDIKPKEIAVSKANKQSFISQDSDSETDHEEDVSDEESDQDNSSKSKNSLINDEADEASEDYESGDSQDEEERQYAKDNEIMEKGETLTSDENISNNSDYEKDSFLVSSDEDDNELLDGSGDDLSTSDNELTMSAKSKKKYNERKSKEQKRASREMFQARHNKSLDSNTKKSARSKRQRIDSTLLDSGSEHENTSTQSNSVRANNTETVNDSLIGRKKKKAQRLSESVNEDENEITVCEENKNQSDVKDPLENNIKQEPKTPQSSMNMSVIQFTDRQEIEEVQVDGNISMIKSNMTSDPLQNTNIENEFDDSSSDEEIKNNYESLLNSLNNEKKDKKAINLSLINDKTKKSEESIVDHLNLTQTRRKERKIKSANDKVTEAKPKKDTSTKKPSLSDNDENSSDSIDMRLLFPDDDSEEKPEKIKGNDDFIPLKRTEAKTNIQDNKETPEIQNSFLIQSAKKKKNRTSQSEVETDEVDSSIHMFIDTTGSVTEPVLNTSNNKSKNTSICMDTTNADNSEAEKSINKSLTSSTKKKKDKKNSITVSEALEDQESSDDKVKIGETPASITTQSPKKKHSISLCDPTTYEEEIDTSINKSLTSSKKKKKSLSLCETGTELPMNASTMSLSTSLNKSMSKSEKKKRASSSFSEQMQEPIKSNDTSLNLTVDGSSSLTTSTKKKNKKKNNVSILEQTINDNVDEAESKGIANTSCTANVKKTKGVGNTNEQLPVSNDDDTPEEIPFVKDKNTQSSTDIETGIHTQSSSEKKKKKKKSNIQAKDSSVTEMLSIEENNDKPKKRKLSAITSTEIEAENISKSSIHDNEDGRKKIKFSDEINTQGGETVPKKRNRKRKQRDEDSEPQISMPFKKNNFDKIQVPKLPVTVLRNLQDKPNVDMLQRKKAKVVSTSEFKVEETKTKRTKPSNYLEDSIYLNDDDSPEKRRHIQNILKKPKVLPFIPTASTSEFGFTTNFRVSIVPQETVFIAKSNDVLNFKNDYINNKKIKKFGTYDMYKRNRNIKMSKF